MGQAHIAYIPNGKVIGLSKLARVVEVVSKRPQVQERMTEDIANLLVEELDAKGVAVVIEAAHTCMTIRGVRKPGSICVTSAMKGVFRSNQFEPLRSDDAHLRRTAVEHTQMLVLSQFVLRLSFGLALAMGLTSARKVTSGYFRNHAYVLLGLNVLATLAALANRRQLLLWPPLAAAVLSYLCAAVWLYEKPRLGTALLWVRRQLSRSSAPGWHLRTTRAEILWLLDPLTGGLLLGSTIAAMFLGHWYLNTPTMEIAPLNKLLGLMALAVVARAAVCAIGLRAAIERHRIFHHPVSIARPPLGRRHYRRRRVNLDELANAQNSQHAKRHRHSLRGRHRRLSRRADQPATVRHIGISGMM